VDASRVSRRALLGATAATSVGLLAGGCAATEGSAGGTDIAPTSGGDVDVATAALFREDDFRSLCLRIRRRHPALADRLDVLISGQRVHQEALAEAVPDGVSTDTARVVPVPRQEQKAVALVAAAAGRLERLSLDDAMAAESGALARLMASIAASHAVTAEAWRR